MGGVVNIQVGTLPPATPAYVAGVSESADHTAVLLTLTAGPIGVRPAVFWTGSDVPNLNTNWSDRLNWQLPGAPGVQDNVVFNNTAAQSVSALSAPGGGSSALLPENFNNIVDANFTITSLTYTNLGATYHNTAIASGKALNLTNTLTVGALDSGSTAQQEFVTVSGANATLSLVNTNANLQVWVGSGSAVTSQATLDLSALDNFNATISRLTVGASAINNAINRPSGILYLAKTNVLTLGFQTTTSEAGTTTGNSGIVVGDCNQNNGSPSFIYLGHANTIAADTISIGRQKANGNLRFNPIYANTAPYPSVTIQGFSSSQVSFFDVGDGAGNTGTTSLTADADLRGGRVTAAVDTMNIGRAKREENEPNAPATFTSSALRCKCMPRITAMSCRRASSRVSRRGRRFGTCRNPWPMASPGRPWARITFTGRTESSLFAVVYAYSERRRKYSVLLLFRLRQTKLNPRQECQSENRRGQGFTFNFSARASLRWLVSNVRNSRAPRCNAVATWRTSRLRCPPVMVWRLERVSASR